MDAVDELDTRPWIFAEEVVAVEIDLVAEARDRGSGGDAEPRLDHAAEHHTEPERPGRRNHAQRLADPTGLRQLDVDAVTPLDAVDDVVQRVAVLVDVDRNRGALLQLKPFWVAGRQRLLAVLDAELGELRERVQRLIAPAPTLVDVDADRSPHTARTARTRSAS